MVLYKNHLMLAKFPKRSGKFCLDKNCLLHGLMKKIRKRSQVKRFPAESGVQGCLPAYAFADRPACAMHLSACGHAQAGADRPLSN
jgi:hypothetical protein